MSEERQETVSDIVAKIRSVAYIQTAESPSSVLKFADRIEAALKREREATSEDYSQVGNAATMREALVMVKRLFDGRIMFQQTIRKAHEAVNAALAKPPRNCDRFGGDLKMLHIEEVHHA